jgi:hypothetical protein
MIVETFFLVEEKRAICTRIFQDLLQYAFLARNVGVCAAQIALDNWQSTVCRVAEIAFAGIGEDVSTT